MAGSVRKRLMQLLNSPAGTHIDPTAIAIALGRKGAITRDEISRVQNEKDPNIARMVR